MNWSDIAMGDGNPQTQVALCNSLEEARSAVVALVNAEYCPEDEDGEELSIQDFAQAVEFLKTAPGSPEISIDEIAADGVFQYLTRNAIGNDDARMFNGHREIGEPESNGLICTSCRRRLRNDAVEKIAQLEKEVLRLRDILGRR
jgi:hypothetical protein